MRVFVIILMLLCFRVNGQNNLVPNPSFEQYDTCPNYSNDIENAIPWFQPNNPHISWWGSTDYFNPCSNGTAGVPVNFAGYQMPRTGSGYGGFAPFGSTADNYGHEYLEVELMDSCVQGRVYCISFYLVWGGDPWCLGTSAIGTYFSEDTCQYNSSGYLPMNVSPQAVNDSDNVIVDSLNWQLIKMRFLAQGGERFVTIGNFWDASYNAQHSVEICGGGSPYYYIDDVSIVMLPQINAGDDSLIVSGDTLLLSGTTSEFWVGMQFEWLPHAGLDDPYSLTPIAYPDSTTTYVLTVSCPTCDVPCLEGIQDSVTVFVENKMPPPSLPVQVATVYTNDQFFYINNVPPNTRLHIYDTRGRLIFFSENYSNEFSLINLSPAIYTYQIELPDSQKIRGKFSIVRR